MKSRLALVLSVLIAVAFAATACNVSAADPNDFILPTPGVIAESVSPGESAVGVRWGDIVRWRIEGADWSIQLPAEGEWESANPFNPSDFSPNAATYRSNISAGGASAPSVFVDVVRLDLGSISLQQCARPVVISPDGNLISLALPDMSVDGLSAMITRITTPAADGSSTGTFEVCLVAAGAMYQMVAAARPASAQTDLFNMIASFHLES